MNGLRRWSANWLRLSLLVCPSWVVFFTDRSCFRRYGQNHSSDPFCPLDFDASLGFPGEGPRSHWWFGFFSLLASIGHVGATGASHGDELRRKQREGLELPDGRRVTDLTLSIRGQLAAAFNGWLRRLRNEGMSFENLANPPDLDKVKQCFDQAWEASFCIRKALLPSVRDTESSQCPAAFVAQIPTTDLGSLCDVDFI